MSQPMPQQDNSMMNGTLDPQMSANMENEIPQDMTVTDDPNAMPQEPNMNMDSNNNVGSIERTKKNIQKNIGKACSDFRNYQGQDKEELGKWIEGMLDSLDGDSDDDNIDFNDNEPNTEEEQMPMESVYSKKGLKRMNEVFGSDNETKEKHNNEKKKAIKTTKSPFNNPNFK